MLLKLIIVGVAIFVVYKLFMGDKQKKQMKEARSTKERVAAGSKK